MNDYIPLSVPNLQGNEEKYVVDCVRTEWVSSGGSYVIDFEKSIARAVHVPEAVACQSGTAGLHTGLMLLGVTREDAVIVPTLTFIAAVNPVRYIGAEPLFMDCDDYLCMDPEKLRSFCENECHMQGEKLIHTASARHVKAMVVVHVFGNLADMPAIMLIAEKYHIKVLEDATEALGTHFITGKYDGKYAGTIGHIGVYSFNGNKIVTTGGGGMIVSNDQAYIAHARHLTTQAKADELNYIHDEVGYNYRLTNIQAALGLAQMEQLPGFIEVKKRNYELYKKGLESLSGLRLLPFREGTDSNHWLYALYVEDDFPLSRDEVIQFLSRERIQSRPIWGLVHEQEPYSGSYAWQITRAKDYWRHVVNVPCSTNLTEANVIRVLECLKEAAR